MANETTFSTESANAPQAEPRQRSKFRVIVWAVGIVVIGGMLAAVLLPSLCRTRESANRIKCASNLRQIGEAITLYAKNNGGVYPPSLAVLPEQEQILPAVMICPSSNDAAPSATDAAGVSAALKAAETNAPGHEHCLSYLYVGRGLTTSTVSAAAIVVYEPLANHDGSGTNVLFGDGHVEFVGKQSWPSIAAAAGVAVVPTSTTRP